MQLSDTKYSEFLERVARELDIPPGKYKDAVNRYHAVGRWLERGEYSEFAEKPEVYPQGSFRLGTVVRPIRNGIEASYDIDLVCQLPLQKRGTTPLAVKHTVGTRLKEHDTYRGLLDSEGRRCWTLEYSESDGVGFHLDVLPAVLYENGPSTTAIAITDKNDGVYSWSPSDPRGYGNWFDSKNAVAFARVANEQKQAIQRGAAEIYASVDDVPDQLIRTPLQRSIQLMKRHRDLHFNKLDIFEHAPISIIITTLAAHLYAGEADILLALSGIVRKLQAHVALLEGRSIEVSLATIGLIQRLTDGTWRIRNPVNPAENFADRWHEDNHARARAFFAWVTALRTDLLNVSNKSDSNLVKQDLTRVLGSAVVTKHLDVLTPLTSAIETTPRIQIRNPAKPWGKS